MSDADDDIDALVAALKSSGWDRQTNTQALASEDVRAAEKLLGSTNARRLASTPRGGRVRMVRTSEVYCVRNSRGWLVGAIEGKRNRPLYDGLSLVDRDRVLRFARDRGFNVVLYENPMREEAESRPARAERRELPRDPAVPSKPSTPSGRAKPSRRFAMLQQVGKFRA